MLTYIIKKSIMNMVNSINYIVHITTMKRLKILIVALSIMLASFCLVPINTYADDACSIAGINDELICGTSRSDEELALMQRIRDILSAVYLWIGIIAVVFIVIGGISYMTSQGNPEKIKRSKSTILYSLCGLIITLAAFAITNFTIGALYGTTQGGPRPSNENDPLGSGRGKARSIIAIDDLTLVEGQSAVIKAKVVPDYALNRSVSFSIDNQEIATIDNDGKVKAIKEGEAKITIKSPDGPTKEVSLTVKKPIPVTEIKLSKDKVTLKKNQSETVSATPLPRNATDKTLIWASQDTKIATVDQKGKIKAIKSGSETYVTVTARNDPVFALNKSPNKITLADVAVNNNFPKVEVKIKVIVQSDFYACTTSTTVNKKYTGDLEIRKITKQIIDKRNKDFYYHNQDSVLARKGGYTKYVKELGGIFSKFPGVEKKFKIKSACDYQAAAEYTYGLWTIWGVDYDNGRTYHFWGGSTSDQSDAYWKGASGRYVKGAYAYEDVDTNLSAAKFKDKRRTNCNFSADSLTRKTDLAFHWSANDSGSPRISNTRDLQVGDMVHYYSGGRWRHVAMVGEVYSDYVILYDGGGRYIETKQFKKKVKRGGYGEMLNGTVYGYDRWVAVRHWKIDQSKILGGLK